VRHAMRSISVLLVSLLGIVCLAIASAFTAAFAFGATALIVPGTGTPNAENVSNYMAQAQKRYLQGTSCAVAATCTLEGVEYPASFWPLVIFPNWCRSGPDGCDKWDESVGKGTEQLEEELAAALATPSTDPSKPDIIIFGYSQGGAVVSNVLAGFENLSPEKKQEVIDRVQIVTIGGIQTPDGGLWSRLGFLKYIPILDVTLTPPMKPDTGVNFTSYAFHYDPVADAPRYWGNAFAMLNAIAALETVHGYYLTPNGNGLKDTLPYGYTDATLAEQLNCTTHKENCRTDKYGNQYVVIPAKSLPIADLAYQLTPAALRPIVKPFIELVAPMWRVLAELGYDYSGDPSVATPLSLLPFNPLTFNPITFAFKMIGAFIQGVVNAFGGGTSLSPLNPPETADSTLMKASSQLASGQDDQPTLMENKGMVQGNQLDNGEGNGTLAALGGEQTLAGTDTLQGLQDQGTIDQAAADKLAADQLAADQAAAEKAAADQLAADTLAAEKEAAQQAAAQQDVADQAAAAAKAAADKDVADKLAADKVAAKKEAADKAAEKKAAAATAKEAQKAAEKARRAAAREAADKAKAAAEKAKDNAAANNGTTKQGGADPEKADPADGNADGAGETEKKAA
jgi:PE-PPE domain-containing protein